MRSTDTLALCTISITHLTVLFHHLGKVREEDVVLPQKVKGLVLLFSHHQLVHELDSITSNKLGSQLDNVPTTSEQVSTCG